MPTAAQLRSAKKKLRKVVKKPNNTPRIVNSYTYIVIKTDPATIRKKEEIKLRKEMQMHKNEYMAAMKKLRNLKK